jgi:Mor family transcriptional regulator
MSAKLPETAVLLIRLIGNEAALRMMEPAHYGGKPFTVPKGEVGRGEQTFATLAEVVGQDNAMLLCRHFGGAVVYVPLLDKMHRDKRNRNIVASYNGGTSVWNLASENKISVRQVWNILKGTDMEEVGETSQQDSLF